jgi:hypothetical protein
VDLTGADQARSAVHEHLASLQSDVAHGSSRSLERLAKVT